MHEIQAIIGTQAAIKDVCEALPGAGAPRELGAGLWIFGVDEDNVGKLPGLRGFGYPDLAELKVPRISRRRCGRSRGCSRRSGSATRSPSS